MVFSSMNFLWAFLPLTLAGTLLVRKLQYQNVLLLIASFVFYALGEPRYVFLLIFSVLMNWGFGMAISAGRRFLLVPAVISNLALLGYFKYADFVLNTLDHLLPMVDLPRASIPLPIGISFFTFQAMSYLIDLYRGETKAQRNPLYLALYISFFPQLIAGPIVKYRDIEAQITDRKITAEGLAEGFRRFIYGLGKKVLIANVLAVPADKIFSFGAANTSFAAGWLVVFLYGLQIYYDFSGYSDMAIGLGRMFGFRFKENFDYPYLSVSIREYWRRWHISLSSWFRDYLYIPLGGSRRGEGRTLLNLMIVFGVTGLWHGASWNFAGWGLYHGVFVCLERIGLSKIVERYRVLGHIYTLLVISVGWVFFCLGNFRESLTMLKHMLMPWVHVDVPVPVGALMTPQVVIAVIAGVLGCGIIQHLTARFSKGRAEYLYLTAVLCYSIVLLVSGMYNPFIYTRF